MSREPFDDGVDVDAAWAEIVANWDAGPARPDDPFDLDAHDSADESSDQSRTSTAPETSAEQGTITPESAAGTPDRTDRPDRGAPGPTGPDTTDLDATGQDATGLGDVPAESGTDATGTQDSPSSASRPHSRVHRPSGPRPRRLDTRHLNPRPSGPRDSDPDGPSFLDGLDGDDEEGYVPPEPPPLPRPGLVDGLAWLGAIGAPAFLLLAVLFWRTVPALWIGAAVLAFVAGFVTLVIRLPDRDDDADDGAVV